MKALFCGQEFDSDDDGDEDNDNKDNENEDNEMAFDFNILTENGKTYTCL